MSTFPSVQAVEAWITPQLGDYADDFDIDAIVSDIRSTLPAGQSLNDLPLDDLNAILQAHDISARG
ncbi:hypothetical protein [Actinomyces sp. HMSC065F12]|uniref:hypothetical protein n=1 Tax=Actinomyces sp. HMSC065F12 TaxID=1739479 RepID=UPI0008A2B8AA|nr:hypothetical protein [Actinomyces sp. HMSC065F12]OFP69581.1 hypothetical protein HMPREF2975_03585 [Actinomyces sp. HMSC065F12]